MRRKQVTFNISVNCFLADIELVGIVGNNVMRRLSVEQQGADKLIEGAQLIF
jgi:hypothetical protein